MNGIRARVRVLQGIGLGAGVVQVIGSEAGLGGSQDVEADVAVAAGSSRALIRPQHSTAQHSTNQVK